MFLICENAAGAYSSTPVHPGPALPAPPRPSLGHINSRPSVVIGCPASYATDLQWAEGLKDDLISELLCFFPRDSDFGIMGPGKVAFLKVQLRSIAAPACVCPSHLANGAQVLIPLPILPVLPVPPRHQHQHPSTADHPPSLAAQRAMWTAAPVCAFLKPPADGALVPQHPPQPCQPQAQPQCHPVPSKADHLRCRDARRATRTAAHVHLAALRL